MPRLVFLRDSASLAQIPEAAALLEGRGLVLVRTVAPGAEADVVALVTGLGRLSVADAAPFPGLRVVAQFGAGTDNIEVAGLWAARGILVTCTANLSNRHVAELALAGLILALRHAPQDAAGLRAEPFAWRAIDRGLGLSESVVGIAGAGSIGLEVARVVAPLARRLLVWSGRGRALSLPDGCEQVADLPALADQADAVTIHLALHEATRGVVGAAFFGRVRAAGRRLALVNTSRGGVVDEAALLAALEDGTIRAAAIDVWSREGATDTPAVQALRRHRAVLPTSHVGAYTQGVQRLYAIQVARNILAALDGRLADVAEHVATPGVV